MSAKENSTGRSKHSIILILAIVAFVCFIAVACVLNYSAAAQNQRKAAEANTQCEKVERENSELSSFLDDENHDEYYERIARDDYDYAKPGERVYYYDSSDD